MTSLRLIDETVDSPINWKEPIKKIGLDGKGVNRRKQIFNLTNLDKNEVIGVFPDLTQVELKKRLMAIDERFRMAVRQVCTDMDSFFTAIIKECFPKARIVVDHFHVIQWAIKLVKDQKLVAQEVTREKFAINQLLTKPAQKLTEAEFQKLNHCFDKVPALKESWKILHQLRKVYWQPDYRKARHQLRYVIWRCRQSGIWEMNDLANTLTRWFEEILNYYISKTTNAYTEGIHNHFERIKRNHFGIRNIDRFCKRLLFCLMPMSIFTQIITQRC
ncbi:MAG: hypothetical protein A3H70_04785 [Candidatus Komeilibacteria bacterium RIFCSPLOWO2_02_FULL_48_11]|uniref:Transposase IS204/IS1001/IS1096/IS1165 DDE domain-containing protein n=1 Tax=Candidatus Komeilibacteria bacterium RIFCSPLOWO2_02_FULL_48_11 TaxID=1798553 RepID=A0A1G2BSJ8_9BACT|nr:MAG: hypothetical protein A3H70_04785 [Candidatus Komeilibacteria bacterium RIFCSPLOWO2_02_FULL_48_11]